ncbi:MAG TPA: hypothetical protein VF516_12460 [Kofleriaceae bacterium]
MTHTQATSGRSSTSSSHPSPGTRPRTVTRPVALPATRAEALELRDLLEANLQALRALHEEHRRMLELNLRTVDSASDLRRELRAIGSPRAPWVRALSETRALLFVALRELIIGANQAELSMHLPKQPPADPRRPER